MSEIDPFKYATRTQLRYPSARGEITTEQLWTLPLVSKDGFDLDTIARTIHKRLKEAEEESFVSTARNPETVRFEYALEIVKSVIEYRQEEQQTKERRAAAKKEKERLENLLAKKQDEEDGELTTAQLQKRLARLNSSLNDS